MIEIEYVGNLIAVIWERDGQRRCSTTTRDASAETLAAAVRFALSQAS